MSTATGFATLSPFPFCPSDISSSVGVASYVDNLTLADVMAFAWNLETFTITTNGSVTNSGLTANGNLNFTLSPIASSTYTRGSNDDAGMVFGAAFTQTAFGSWPASRQPRERVCVGSQSINGCIFNIAFNDGSAGNDHNGTLRFYVGTDPVNAGKFRLYYLITLVNYDSVSGTVWIEWTNRSSGIGGTLITSGTITLGGIVLTWYSFKSTGSVLTGTGGMSALSTSFTY